MADFGLRGRHIVVTGGSRGIGRALVLAAARQGARVTACHTRAGDAATALGKELAGLGADHEVVRADVADPGAVDRMISAAYDRFGPVHGLVNNAGVVSSHPLADLDPLEWHRVLDVNLTAMYLVVRAALERFAPTASVVNVSSAVAMRGMAARAHYTAAKSGVFGLTRSLCKELAPRGIRVNAVAPGLVETDQMAGVPEAARSRYTAMIALGRVADPAEVAEPVLFLLSDAARYVTGATLHVDGGI